LSPPIPKSYPHTAEDLDGTEKKGNEDGGNDPETGEQNEGEEHRKDGSSCRDPVAFLHPYDGEDERIKASDRAPDEWNDPKQMPAVGIGDRAKGCSKPRFVSSDNDETEVGDATCNHHGEKHHQRQCDHDERQVNAVGKRGRDLVVEQPSEKDPLPKARSPKPMIPAIRA